MDRQTGGVWRPSYPKPEDEKEALRAVIKTVNPDILALQEIGGPEFLQELRADLAMEGFDYPYAIHMSGADQTRHTALLSRWPAVEVVEHGDLDFKYLDRRQSVKRGLLEVSFHQLGGSEFKVFVVHLKSPWSDDKRDPESALWRTGEATACRNRIIERSYEQGVEDFLIAGDFNDHPDSAAMHRFSSRGSRDIASLVPAWDRREERWTYYNEKCATYSLVDGIFISPSLASRVEGGRGWIADIPESMGGSDHRLVYLDLNVPLQTDSPPIR